MSTVLEFAGGTGIWKIRRIHLVHNSRALALSITLFSFYLTFFFYFLCSSLRKAFDQLFSVAVFVFGQNVSFNGTSLLILFILGRYLSFERLFVEFDSRRSFLPVFCFTLKVLSGEERGPERRLVIEPTPFLTYIYPD